MRDGSVACLKVRYYTETEAGDDMRRIAARPLGNRVPIRVYHCPMCRGFHTTSRRA